MKNDGLYLVTEDLMRKHLTISVEQNSLTASVNFEEPNLVFNVNHLCTIKRFLAEAISTLRPRLKNVEITATHPYEIRVVKANEEYARLGISPSVDSAVYMSLKNLMWSRRYITDCITEMILNRRKEKAYLKRLRGLDDYLEKKNRCRPSRPSCWGG
jgi:hypothetical protein